VTLAHLSIAFPLAVAVSACSSGGSGSTRSTGTATDPTNSKLSGGPSASGGDSSPADAGSVGVGVGGGGGCPAKGDAAACAAPPAGFGLPTLPPNAPPIPEPGYWVGCEFTNCSSESSCTTCSCVDADGGAEWDCASNSGFQPETDAAPTPYCALNSGPLDTDIGDVGPVEQCTPQYPTCTGPYPESPGRQCCLQSTVGGLTQISCMPNDSGAYGNGFGPGPL
jgi:hypothetical protein